MMIQTDICIVGAGPAGAATALRLSKLGIPSVVIDKATFPRDKVCGDALSGKVFELMDRIDPDMLKRFHAGPPKLDTWGIRFVAPNKKPLDIPFIQQYSRDRDIAPGYVSKRLDFDNFLADEMKRNDRITFHEGVEVSGFERSETGYTVRTKDAGLVIQARLIIAADGANSKFSRKIAGLDMDPVHHAGAVRAYYRNVSGMVKDNFIELHYLKSITPGYFWIFYLPDGVANVGLGMRTDIISRRRINLKTALLDILENEPGIKERFANAGIMGNIKGFGLPFGSRLRKMSGDHYMLVGDAAHLIDPLTGEGIGNAFYSGFIAADRAKQSLEQQDFSADFLSAYDAKIKSLMGKEMQVSYRIQRIARYPWLLNGIANIIHNNQNIINYFTKMYTDLELRDKITKPWFWMKLLLKK